VFPCKSDEGCLHAAAVLGHQRSSKASLAMLFTAVAGHPAAAVVCSVNIRPMEAQRVALAAGQNGTINPFVVYVEDDQAVAARFCWLTMLDSQVRRETGVLH
jgi:hypothetical protein